MNVRQYLLLLVLLFGATGCSDLFGVDCTLEMRPNLVLEVRDAITGAPAARGAIGSANHANSGITTELYGFADSLQLQGQWAREQAGTYTVSVQKPGFQIAQQVVTVTEDECHVQTEH